MESLFKVKCSLALAKALGARPMEREWVTEIRDQCLAARVPFFFKQWGGVRKSETGRTLDGKTYDEFPETAPRHGAATLAKRTDLLAEICAT